jgi:dTDP-4-amino-4,6-dideoxygalactose transaminase
MILFNDIASQWKEIESVSLPKLVEFLRTGPYILGDRLKEFEKNFADYISVKYAVGVSNGTDGLRIAFQALGFGEKPFCDWTDTPVFVPANSHISDALAAIYQGINPIFIDCDQYYNIDVEDLVRRGKMYAKKPIVIAVHMYGQAADIPGIRKHFPKALIIEDCSQSFGATIEGRPVGTFGDIAVFSLYPTKNLGALGDAGIVVTNNAIYYDRLKALRDYGSFDRKDYVYLGGNHRLDDIQALILNDKLPYIKTWISKKREHARLYNQILQNIGDIILPAQAPYADESTYHIYPIRTEYRDNLRSYLDSVGIPTAIHYSMPLHQISLLTAIRHVKNAEHFSKTILSLPMHQYLAEKDIRGISDAIKNFFRTKE